MIISSSKPHGNIQLDRSHPIAQSLAAYWPLTDGGGRRPIELVGGNGPSLATSLQSFPLSWGSTGPVGLCALVPSNSAINAGLTYRTAGPAIWNGSVGDITIGMLIQIPAGSTTSRPINITTTGFNWRMCAAGTTDSHWRVDFINATSYFRINTGQLTAGEWRTMFASRRPGVQPVATSGVWPDGPLTNPTYLDRGSASGNISLSEINILNWNNGGATLVAINVAWIGLWARYLRDEEMQELHRHPWCMLRDTAYGYRKVAGGAVAAGGWFSRVQHGGQPGAAVIS